MTGGAAAFRLCYLDQVLIFLAEVARRAALTLEGLYRAHAPLLRRQAQRLCGPGVSADDVVQDVFLIAQRRLDDIDPDHNPGGYLHGVMRNVIRSHRRRARRTAQREQDAAQALDPHVEAAHPVERKERRRKLARCLAALPDKQREAVTLVELEQLSVPETAALMGTSSGAVHSLLSRGRRRLAQLWQADPGGAP